MVVEQEAEVPMREVDDNISDEHGAVFEESPRKPQEKAWGIRVEEEWAPQPKPEGPLISSPTTSAIQPSDQGPLTPLKDLTWSGSHAIKKTSQAEEFDNWLKNQLAHSKQLDYKATFMTHATLYVIACQKELDELKNMAWQRLRSLLVAVGPLLAGWPIIANMVALIQYTYKETSVSELAEDPLRDLVTSFVAIHFTKFKGPEVDNLFYSELADDREFVVELMVKVRQSMENLETLESTGGDTFIGGDSQLGGSMYYPTSKSKKKGRCSGFA